MLQGAPDASLSLLAEGALALGLGLIIGLEREHRHVDDKQGERTILGVRTFALLGLTGWLAAVSEERWAWLPGVLLGLVGALVLAQYLRASQGGNRLGITTELAALLTVVFGMLVHSEPRLAVALALVTTMVLISKPWVQFVMPQLLRTELLAALQFLIVAAVLLPLLPAEAVDPWGVIQPQRIGKFVVLIAGVGFIGYALTRLLGDKRAAALTGLVGGLASSTAVTASMAQRAGRQPSAAPTAALTALAANVIVAPRVFVVALVIAPEVGRGLIAPLGTYAVVMLLATWRAARAASKAPAVKQDPDDPLVRNPFELLPALKWGALLSAVLVIAYWLQRWLGDAGLLLTGAVAGLTDVDGVLLAGVRQVEAGTLGAETAVRAILIAVLANSLAKSVMSRVTGGPAFGRMVAPALLAAALLALAVGFVV